MTTIEYSDLVFEDRVGVGRFATVYKGRWKSRGVTVAIKTSAQEISSSEVCLWLHVASFQLLGSRTESWAGPGNSLAGLRPSPASLALRE